MRARFTEKKVKPFAEYLRSNGAEIMELTNPWELLRYKFPECGTIVIYSNSKGKLTIPSLANEHFERFISGKAIKVHRRAGADVKEKMYGDVVGRDGCACCLCNQFLDASGETDRTFEHLLSTFHGGNNHIGNMALAHQACNRLLGNLSVMEKIRLRDRVRDHMRTIPPWEFVEPSSLFAKFHEPQS